MNRPVLVVDDDRAMCDLIAARLSTRGFEVVTHNDPEAALRVVGEQDFDVLVADLNMPALDGLELSRRVAAICPDLPIVVVTAFGSLDTAVAAIRAGAYDFITKPFEIEQLALTLERARQHRQLRQEVKRLRETVAQTKRLEEIVGECSAIRKLAGLIEGVALSEATVLVTGESGTGKELAARAIHARGKRRKGPFVAVSCSTLTETLLETELFGDARSDEVRPGAFMHAKGGTLFLDEIGGLPPGSQAKLLRAIETRTVRPFGGEMDVPVDARIVASTTRDIETEVEEGRFRRDLYFRINVIRAQVPPLRARGNDILLLAQFFLEQLARRWDKGVAGISPGAAERLLTFSWPGNVRELQNVMEHAVAITRFERIVLDDLPERVRDHRTADLLFVSDNPAELLPMHEVEKRYVLRVLEAVGGNKTLAAQILGFDRRTMYRKLERYADDDG